LIQSNSKLLRPNIAERVLWGPYLECRISIDGPFTVCSGKKTLKKNINKGAFQYPHKVYSPKTLYTHS
jgi:hypothetical protein